jgi:hypothetical protein
MVSISMKPLLVAHCSTAARVGGAAPTMDPAATGLNGDGRHRGQGDGSQRPLVADWSTRTGTRSRHQAAGGRRSRVSGADEVETARTGRGSRAKRFEHAPTGAALIELQAADGRAVFDLALQPVVGQRASDLAEAARRYRAWATELEASVPAAN